MKNLNKKVLLLVVAAVIVIAGGAVFALNATPSPTTPAEQDAALHDHNADHAAETSGDDVSYDNASLPSDPLGVRTLGDPSAPIKIEEFASLTCGHCAHFHASTFRELKRKYIDTGKVFFTFTDFPLNAPAVDAAMVARCMPPERYFTFLSFLFSTQEQWAFTQDYKNSLRQNAKLAGMTDERFDSCLADTALKEGIVTRMKEKSETHQVNSTPSFVINGKTVLNGALPIVSFDNAITEAEAEQQ